MSFHSDFIVMGRMLGCHYASASFLFVHVRPGDIITGHMSFCRCHWHRHLLHPMEEHCCFFLHCNYTYILTLGLQSGPVDFCMNAKRAYHVLSSYSIIAARSCWCLVQDKFSSGSLYILILVLWSMREQALLNNLGLDQ